MFNNVTELFLGAYFLIEKIAGKLVKNSRLLFDKLACSLLLNDEDKDALFALTQRQEVRELVTYNDYAQVCRIQKYVQLADCMYDISDETQQVITIKGNALRKAKQFEMDNLAENTEATICKLITDGANRGYVASLCALGFLQCEGLYVDRNLNAGLKNFEKAAQWNNVEGILFALYYDVENRQTNLNRLRVVTDGNLNDEIFNCAIKRYGPIKTRAQQESKLLQKAFGAGILKSDIYMSQYARFIFSEVLSIKDKERALFSGHKEAISETADLPLKLSFGKIVFDAAAMLNHPLLRKTESEKICRYVRNSDMRGVASYRPLCICADSETLGSFYLDAICKALHKAHVEKIDVADLCDYDLEPTKNNVFVRSCDEDKANVYVLCVSGDVRDYTMNSIKNFLQSDKRKKIRLQHPSAVIDLSAVLPICFCDKQNARLLRPYCEVITLSPVNDCEKREMIEYLFDEKANQYDFDAICAAQGVTEALARFSLDDAAMIIDRIAQYNRCEGSLTITEQMIKDATICDVALKSGYGFGGVGNESK